MPVLAGVAIAWVWRLILIWMYPGNYAFDGLQRWSGREYVLVQDWLPATQMLVRICSSIGLSLGETRGAMALVGAASIGVATAIAGRLGGVTAAWACVPFALFGPHVAWTIVPYQEGIFLLLVLGAVLAALHERWVVADLLMGASGLVRYEGWPFIFIWMVWRKDLRASIALWGVATWLAGKFGFGWTGHHPSPVDIRDWEGMFTRFKIDAFFRNTGYNLERLWDSGAWIYILGCIGGAGVLRHRVRGLMWTWVLLQVAITFAWMIALERSMSRMLVVPISLIAPLGAVGLAHLYRVAMGETIPGSVVSLRQGLERTAKKLGIYGVVGLLACLLAMESYDGWWRVRREINGAHWERAAVMLMRRCPECVWWIEPRAGFGPRGRHDGCEVIQGLSPFLHGRDFYCAGWLGDEERAVAEKRLTSRVEWNDAKQSYMVWRTWEASLSPEQASETGSAPPAGEAGP